MPARRSRTAVALHWLIAALFFGLTALGAWMTEIGYYHRFYHSALDWHRTLGVCVFVFAAIFTALKIFRARPADYSMLAPWESFVARATHGILFALLLLVPASGYAVSTSAGDAVPLFGGVAVPALFGVSETAREFAVRFHYWAAYAGAGLAALHAAAALKHHYIDKNDILRRMLWRTNL